MRFAAAWKRPGGHARGSSAALISVDLDQWSQRTTLVNLIPMRDTNVPNTHDLRGLRILIVEDAQAVVNALQTFLEDFGMVIVGPVSNPHAAMQLLAERPPDVALIDMHLDGDTGYALVERMSEVNVPVVAMSGSAALPAGGPSIATLQKPFSGHELLTTLQQVVRVNQHVTEGQSPEAG